MGFTGFGKPEINGGLVLRTFGIDLLPLSNRMSESADKRKLSYENETNMRDVGGAVGFAVLGRDSLGLLQSSNRPVAQPRSDR